MVFKYHSVTFMAWKNCRFCIRAVVVHVVTLCISDIVTVTVGLQNWQIN